MTATPPVRAPIVPTNSLILLLPQPLFAPSLLPLFEAHFGSYGEMVSWTALEKLGRVFVVYDDHQPATQARREMDGFVWEDEVEQQQNRDHINFDVLQDGVRTEVEQVEQQLRIPLRVFFGPQLSLPLPTLESTLLSVPALSRNFLISPPGSPPVGWEQTLEEAPNSQTHAHDADDGAAGAWGDELARALRFLSVSGGGDEDDDGEVQPVPSRRRANLGLDSDEEDDGEPTTSVVLPHNVVGATARPAVTVSTPAAAAASGPGTDGATPPAGAAKITAVKATIESLLGRKRSFSGLERPKLESPGASTPTFGASLLGGSKITPTARPPVGLVRDFVE